MNVRTALRPFQWAKHGLGLWLGPFLAMTLFSIPFSLSADTPQADCLIMIDGVVYDPDPCGGGLGAGDLGRYDSYWAAFFAEDEGIYRGYWNGGYGNSHAHADLGMLTPENRAGRVCFSNERALLCSGILPDTPVYRVALRSREEGGNVVLAYLDGIEYKIPHPNWDTVQPYSVEQSADLDGDGRPETFISVGHSGNCCPNNISVLSYRGGKFFTYLDETPIIGGWGGFEIVTQSGRPIIRVNDVPSGPGNTADQRGHRDYAFINGRLELISERIELGLPSEVAALTLKDVRLSEGERKDLVYDIDRDSQLDRISCGYWERWGVLNCTVEISGAPEALDIQCSRVSVSTTVFGPNRSHRLLCDGNVINY